LDFKKFSKLSLVIVVVALFVTKNTTNAQNPTNCPNAPTSRLVNFRPAHVTPGSANNLRDKASKSAAVLTQIPGDAYIDVLDGPVCADGLAWWHVLYAGQTGWMAEGSGSTYFVEPATSATTRFSLTSNDQTLAVQYQNVSLTYNGVFGTTLEANTVFPVSEVPDNPFQYPAPKFITFTFPDMAIPEQPWLTPTLSVYPVAEYTKVNEQAKTGFADLQILLKTQGTPSDRGIFVLPPINAAQVFQAQVHYMPFKSGSGVRFVTAYAQAIIPLTSDQIRYIFVGFTADGKYFVVLNTPVSTKLLPKTYEDVKDFNEVMLADDNGKTYTAYLNKGIELLNTANPTDFEPSLADLDALIQSIEVR
jgi:hypothetical protein